MDVGKVTAQLKYGSSAYLTTHTCFWVERPRLTASRVSGLETLLSGPYIAIDPVTEGKSVRRFLGLEEPPLFTTSEAGKRFLLRSPTLWSLNIGSPVYTQLMLNFRFPFPHRPVISKFSVSKERKLPWYSPGLLKKSAQALIIILPSLFSPGAAAPLRNMALCAQIHMGRPTLGRFVIKTVCAGFAQALRNPSNDS